MTGDFSMAQCLTVSGRVYDPFVPDQKVVDVSDIAHALSQTCRYGGHPSSFYSVAEHSVLVYSCGVVRARELSANREYLHALYLALLFHDAPEVYLDDAAAPFKERPEMEWYRDLETAWMLAIYQKLGIAGVCGGVEHQLIDTIDKKVRGLEMACLFPKAPPKIQKSWGFDYSAGELGCLPPARAEQGFLLVYNKIESML